MVKSKKIQNVKKLKRRILKKTYKRIEINIMICTIFFLLCLIGIKKEDLNKVVIGFFIIVLSGSLLYLILGFVSYVNKKKMMSSRFVKESMIPGFYMEVFPEKKHFNMFRSFFYREIPKKGKYYAKLSNSYELVRIYIKLDNNNEEEYLLLEKIEPQKFLDCYRLIEEIGTID